MIRNLGRSIGLFAACCALSFITLPQTSIALDTPEVLMTIDSMTMLHPGIFVNGTPADGYNTFRFGPPQYAPGSLGRDRSFYYVKTSGTTDASGVSHNARFHSDAPETWNGSEYAPITGVDFDSAYFSILDRASFGQRFDPAEYLIEVKYKPNTGVAGLPNNTAPVFQVGLDQIDGFVWDEEAGTYKRANDAFAYNVGSPLNDMGEPVDPNLTLNAWYASAPKDADGFATWTVPVSQPDFVQRGFYHFFGDGDFRTANVVTGGGKVFNETTQVWDDVDDGLDPLSFGEGPTDPARPGSQLKVPNGVPLISIGVPVAEQGLSLDIKYIALKRITSNGIMGRIDANSGITFRFGSGFTRSNTGDPINVDGFNFLPAATDQISRFDENGMTNLKFNMRQPDNTGETHRFLVRGGPNAQVFDGTTATVNVRAKLLEGNTAPTLTIVAKDLDGSDTGAGTGADEYTYNLDLSQFNSTTFTTVSIPLSQFTLSEFVPTVPNGTAGSGPFGFANPGDGLMTDFDLYEFGGLLAPDTGLLKLELEYMEIRLPQQGLIGDYNNDSKVDAADYTVWRDNLGADGSTLGANRDPDNTGVVGPADFNSWKSHFGEQNPGSGSLSAGAVPEPATAALSLLGMVLGLVSARRRAT